MWINLWRADITVLQKSDTQNRCALRNGGSLWVHYIHLSPFKSKEGGIIRRVETDRLPAPEGVGPTTYLEHIERYSVQEWYGQLVTWIQYTTSYGGHTVLPDIHHLTPRLACREYTQYTASRMLPAASGEIWNRHMHWCSRSWVYDWWIEAKPNQRLERAYLL